VRDEHDGSPQLMSSRSLTIAVAGDEVWTLIPRPGAAIDALQRIPSTPATCLPTFIVYVTTEPETPPATQPSHVLTRLKRRRGSGSTARR
jgi:hypothetical protein